MLTKGYIKLHRKLLSWRWYQDNNVKSVFLHLLLSASYEERDYENIHLLPGQVLTGRKSLAAATGLSENQVRTAIGKLVATGEITIKTTNQFSVVTLINWGKYQGFDAEDTTPSDAKIHQRATSEPPQYKKDNKDKNIEEYTRTRVKQQPMAHYKNNYDYEAIRQRARENIRAQIAEYQNSQSA